MTRIKRCTRILLRSVGGLPGDPAALALLKIPPRIADAFMGVMRRLSIGDMQKHGLAIPEEGPFARLRRDAAAPAVVDREVLDAIRSGRIEVVAGVESLDASGARLRDGSHVSADAIIAATGYRCGLEPMLGHLGVLDDRGMPRRNDGAEAAPGLRFIGFRPLSALLHFLGVQARRIARAIAKELRRARRARRAISPQTAGRAPAA